MKSKKIISVIISSVFAISVVFAIAFSANATTFTEDDYKLLEKYFANYDMTKYDGFDVTKYDMNDDDVVDLKDLYDLGENVYGIWSGRY